MIATVVEVVAGSLVADAAVVIVALAGVAGFSKLYRGRLLRFFGVGKGAKRIQCYVSRLDIQSGMLRRAPDIWNGYTGAAMNRNEYLGASEVASLFRPWVLAMIPPPLRNRLSTWAVSLFPAEMRIDTAPRTIDDIVKNRAFLLIGTGVHSVASEAAFGHVDSFFEFTRDEDGNRAFRLKHECGVWISFGRTRNPADNVEQGIVQRLTIPFPDDDAPVAKIVICAGLGSNATMNSARFLATNWAAMHRKYGDHDFGLVLKFPQPTADTEELADPTDVVAVIRRDGKVEQADPV